MALVENYFNIAMSIVALIILLTVLIPVIMHEGFSNNNLSSSMGGYNNVQYNRGFYN
jgi:uncharacterized membrane protein